MYLKFPPSSCYVVRTLSMSDMLVLSSTPCTGNLFSLVNSSQGLKRRTRCCSHTGGHEIKVTEPLLCWKPEVLTVPSQQSCLPPVCSEAFLISRGPIGGASWALVGPPCYFCTFVHLDRCEGLRRLLSAHCIPFYMSAARRAGLQSSLSQTAPSHCPPNAAPPLASLMPPPKRNPDRFASPSHWAGTPITSCHSKQQQQQQQQHDKIL